MTTEKSDVATMTELLAAMGEVLAARERVGLVLDSIKSPAVRRGAIALTAGFATGPIRPLEEAAVVSEKTTATPGKELAAATPAPAKKGKPTFVAGTLIYRVRDFFADRKNSLATIAEITKGTRGLESTVASYVYGAHKDKFLATGNGTFRWNVVKFPFPGKNDKSA